MLGICRLSVLILHETLFVPVLIYDIETILWKEMDKGVVQSEEGSR